MQKAILVALAASLALLYPTPIQAQAVNACDLNGDGVVDLVDVQLVTNMALGSDPCTANVVGTGVCTIVVISAGNECGLERNMRYRHSA